MHKSPWSNDPSFPGLAFPTQTRGAEEPPLLCEVAANRGTPDFSITDLLLSEALSLGFGYILNTAM